MTDYQSLSNTADQLVNAYGYDSALTRVNNTVANAFNSIRPFWEDVATCVRLMKADDETEAQMLVRLQAGDFTDPCEQLDWAYGAFDSLL